MIDIKEADDFDTTVDKIRLFLFQHTQYSEGEEFHKIWGDHNAIAKRIIAHADGTSEKRAPLECSSRSGVLENILVILGYPVRSVAVYADQENFISHTFSEVQNPETGKWQVHDVQFNVSWVLKNNGERASINDLIQYGFKEYEPCRTKDNCGWDLPNREGSFAKDLKEHLGLASVKDSQRKTRDLIVNTSRFDLNKPQKVGSKELTYCTYIAKNCRKKIIKYDLK